MTQIIVGLDEIKSKATPAKQGNRKDARGGGFLLINSDLG